MTQRSDVCIRLMTQEDLQTAAQLERECFSDPWSVDMLREELENGLGLMYVAEHGGKVCGYAGMQVILDEGYITNIAVTGSMRRCGIGAKLMQELMTQAMERNLAFITLEVRRSNLAAIGLYERFGFKCEGVRPGYYQNPKEDALLMTLRF